MRSIRHPRQHDASAGLLFLESIDAAFQRSPEDVVRQQYHRAPATGKALGEGEGFGDASRLGLVGVEQPRDPELVAIAQQAQELPRMRATGDQHDLGHAGLDQRLDPVTDHRAVVDREQVLVRDLRQRVKPAAGTAGEDDPFHCTGILLAVLG